MGNHQGCIEESRRIRDIIAISLNPSEYSIIGTDSFVFRVRFSNHSIGLSVSCPADINSRSDANGFVYETGLWCFTSQTLVYREEWDYDDVRHFNDTMELIEEFERVRTLALAFQEPEMPGAIQHYQVPDSPLDYDSI